MNLAALTLRGTTSYGIPPTNLVCAPTDSSETFVAWVKTTLNILGMKPFQKIGAVSSQFFRIIHFPTA